MGKGAFGRVYKVSVTLNLHTVYHALILFLYRLKTSQQRHSLQSNKSWKMRPWWIERPKSWRAWAPTKISSRFSIIFILKKGYSQFKSNSNSTSSPNCNNNNNLSRRTVKSFWIWLPTSCQPHSPNGTPTQGRVTSKVLVIPRESCLLSRSCTSSCLVWLIFTNSAFRIVILNLIIFWSIQRASCLTRSWNCATLEVPKLYQIIITQMLKTKNHREAQSPTYQQDTIELRNSFTETSITESKSTCGQLVAY